MMVQYGADACFMKDKKGYLPAHVACSRHCSPEKLHMLLKVHKAALTAKTNSGDTLLTLAIKSATRSHPNYALIDDLKRRLEEVGVNQDESALLENEQARRISKLAGTDSYERCCRQYRRLGSDSVPVIVATPQDDDSDEEWRPAPIVTPVKSKKKKRSSSTTKKKCGDRERTFVTEYRHGGGDDANDDEREDSENLEHPANLLLNFSRQYTDNKRIKLIASV